MADTTTAGHGEAVKAVAGNVDRDEIVTTRDLSAEQKVDEKLDAETSKQLDQATDGDRKVLAKRTTADGQTEVLLEPAPEVAQFPPDDGGYNPEKRTHAGPGNTKVPSAVGKNVKPGSPLAQGWQEKDLTAAGKKHYGV